MFEQLSVLNQINPLTTKGDQFYDDGFLRIEYTNYFLACGNRTVKLNKIDFLIVSTLAKNIGLYVLPEIIWQNLGNKQKPLNFESLKVRICHLRRQLTPYEIQIEYRLNSGYRLHPSNHL